MLVSRITKTKYAHALVASGFCNRWNDDGQYVIYTSDSRALAGLENLVHRSNSGNDQLFRTISNTRHQDFSKIALVGTESFLFDERL